MGNSSFWAIGTVALALCTAGCGSHKRAPFVNETRHLPTGQGGGDSTDEPIPGAGGAGIDDPGSIPATQSNVDPDEVYISGDLEPHYADMAVFAPVSDANHYFMGFRGGVIRGTSLIYELHNAGDIPQIFQWVPDGTSDLKATEVNYPLKPEANDIALSTPPCSGKDWPRQFLVGPDGRLIYECQDDNVWYEDGAQVYDGSDSKGAWPEWLGYDSMAMTGGLEFPSVMSLKDGVEHRVDSPAPSDGMLARRAVKDGVLVAMRGKLTDDPVQLWHVGADAVAEVIGTYPPLPDGMVLGGSASVVGAAALTTQGDLYAVGYKNPTSAYTLVFHLTLKGAVDVVYDFMTDPRVKGNDLFTGP